MLVFQFISQQSCLLFSCLKRLFYGRRSVCFRPATDPFGSVPDLNEPKTGSPPELFYRFRSGLRRTALQTFKFIMTGITGPKNSVTERGTSPLDFKMNAFSTPIRFIADFLPLSADSISLSPIVYFRSDGTQSGAIESA